MSPGYRFGVLGGVSARCWNGDIRSPVPFRHMDISGDQLKGFAAKRSAVLPEVKPLLSVGEQLVVMTAGEGNHRVPAIVDLFGDAYGQPRDYAGALQSLERAALITRSGLMRHLTAMAAARVNDRWKRVAHVIRNPALPAQDDVDLLIGLAASQALRLGRDDHLRARHHITAAGRGQQLSPFTQLVCDHFGVSAVDELVEALLPPDRHFNPGDFDPGQSAGIAWAAMYGGY